MEAALVGGWCSNLCSMSPDDIPNYTDSIKNCPFSNQPRFSPPTSADSSQRQALASM